MNKYHISSDFITLRTEPSKFDIKRHEPGFLLVGSLFKLMILMVAFWDGHGGLIKKNINIKTTVQSLCDIPRYNTDLDITWSYCGSDMIYHEILQKYNRPFITKFTYIHSSSRMDPQT